MPINAAQGPPVGSGRDLNARRQQDQAPVNGTRPVTCGHEDLAAYRSRNGPAFTLVVVFMDLTSFAEIAESRRGMLSLAGPTPPNAAQGGGAAHRADTPGVPTQRPTNKKGPSAARALLVWDLLEPLSRFGLWACFLVRLDRHGRSLAGAA
jgi:hypothetical protein